MIWGLFLICILRLLFFDASQQLPAVNATLHNLCLYYVSARDLPQIYNGLVCGSRNIGVQTESLFISTGLYHLIVVSGSHLIFIEALLKKLPQRFHTINWIFLFLFSWMCLLNAPIGRAFMSYSLHYVSRKYFLFLRQDQIVLSAGLLSLLVFPEWITSVSFQLSWMAALCMSLPVSKTLKAFLCLLYIAPLLGLQNPVWALNNIFFIALFDVFLFPFTALSLFAPYSSWCAEHIWKGVLFMLTYLPASEPQPKSFATLAMVWNWFFIFSAQLIHFWIRK